MINNIEWLGHSTLKILGDKIIYIDPYDIKNNYNDADIIFITHSHYDHFSIEDIKKCLKSDTKIVVTEDLLDNTLEMGFERDNIISVLPNNTYQLEEISFSTIPAYNIDKKYHPKENNWVGYIINIKGINYYIAGDTDVTDEAKKVKCDVAFLPIGGIFTTDAEEAAMLANIIEPKVVIPIHYGTLVGTKEDAIKFKEKVKDSIKCEIL